MPPRRLKFAIKADFTRVRPSGNWRNELTTGWSIGETKSGQGKSTRPLFYRKKSEVRDFQSGFIRHSDRQKSFSQSAEPAAGDHGQRHCDWGRGLAFYAVRRGLRIRDAAARLFRFSRRGDRNLSVSSRIRQAPVDAQDDLKRLKTGETRGFVKRPGQHL